MNSLKQVQIIDNGAVHKMGKEYPILAKEVKSQDKYSNSSWYGLTEEAYQEWLQFSK
jgi:hypothetical protein